MGYFCQLRLFRKVKPMDLNNAYPLFIRWKIKFIKAIRNDLKINPVDITGIQYCEFSKWLHGECKTKYSHLKNYPVCLDRHAAFHAEVIKITFAVNKQQYLKTKELLDIDSNFNLATKELGYAILHLKEEAKVSISNFELI